MQPLAAPRIHGRCQARGRIMKPRQHEHSSENQISQQVREGACSCERVVGVILCGPPWARGVMYQGGIN
jgi:hypothetical protein